MAAAEVRLFAVSLAFTESLSSRWGVSPERASRERERERERENEDNMFSVALLRQAVKGTLLVGAGPNVEAGRSLGTTDIDHNGSTMESSMMYTERDMPPGKRYSAQRGSRLVFIRRRLERSRWSAVTSRLQREPVTFMILHVTDRTNRQRVSGGGAPDSDSGTETLRNAHLTSLDKRATQQLTCQ
ncbi:hypothetical protein EYF80_027850 [Liparis tanakae]|uniref:Uncharacterized protein n=1 Tax=Liparis tanakae TaxID=230148 RepID=A0A4Z2HA85_9TELE|nr:hypothetical protein EYF80_027850 [Liparis tanakae]